MTGLPAPSPAHGDGVRPLDGPGAAARREVADAVRSLAEALVGHDPGPDVLREAAGEARRLAGLVRAGPARPPTTFDLAGLDLSLEPVPDGADIAGPPDSLFSGQEHPAGMRARMWREGERAVAEVTLSQLEVGPPGRAHGGVVAGLCDDVVRGLLMVCGIPAFTASLTVNLRAPCPLGVPLRLEAWLDRREGRKLWARVRATAEGDEVATAEALMITIGRRPA
jgi:acyl-coenzyme A thioesterase PaaI-like protein